MTVNKHKCPVEATLEVVGGKWKPLILYYLSGGTKRFGELKRMLPNITQRMLTLQLRELEQDRVVQRKVYAEIPPKVEYSLTEFGKSLDPVMLKMLDWGKAYLKKVKSGEIEDE